MEISKITKEELAKLLNQGADILVVDVMNPEYFAEKHIAGAQNAPVYEVAFMDEYIKKIAKDSKQKIVVYSHGVKSLAPQDAAEKLQRVGYENVEILSGGLEEWENAGMEVAKGKTMESSQPSDDRHEIDTEKSIVGWTGRNAKYAHHGKIVVKSGYISLEFGKPVFGEVILDMQTIKDEDIQDETMRGVLEKHLKSSDFFNVEKFPEAKIVLNNFSEVKEANIGQLNYKINGELTIKDVTREIEFLAMITNQQDGSINGQAHFDIDRTLWNVRYGSEKFFEKLGMHLVNDNVSLEIFLVAKA